MASLTLESNLPDAEPLELINGPEIRVAAGAESLRLPVPQFDEAFAESPDTEGGRRVRSRPQLAEGGGKVFFDADDGQAFWEAIDVWQTTIAAMNAHGGTITYEPPDGTPVTYEIESIHITSLPQEGVQLRRRHAESEWVFMARPYGLLDSQTIIGTPVTSTDPLLELEVPDVMGSVDALGKLTLIEAEGQDRSHVVWGLDPNYDPANPVPVLLAADDGPFSVSSAEFDDSFAGVAATVGGFATLQATLSTTPLVICGSGSQQHIGTWRHLVRMRGDGTGPIWVRVVYKLGSSPRFSEGEWKLLQGLGAFYERDLGLMRILEAIEGDTTCEWRIEAYSETDGDTLAVHLDQLIPQPGGKARVPSDLGTPEEYLARSGFATETGALTGDALAQGGNWTAVAGSDTDDFSIDTFGPSPWAKRTAVSDASLNAGRYLYPSGISGLAACNVSLEIFRATAVGSLGLGRQGVFARLVDANNWLMATVDNGGAPATFAVHKRVGGAVTQLDSFDFGPFVANIETFGVRLVVLADGRWLAKGWISRTADPTDADTDLLAEPEEFQLEGYDAALATGGALASGRVGMYDAWTSAVASTRWFDNFLATSPITDRALYSGQEMEIRSSKVIRENAAGEPGRIASEGAYLRIPPAGREGRTHRLVARARRHDVDVVPDTVLDDQLSGQLEVTPRVAILSA